MRCSSSGRGAIRRSLVALLVLALFPWQTATAAEPADVDPVTAEVETTPVVGSGDAADDPAVWIHPDDPSRSLVFGNDKDGRALEIYDLDGTRLGRITDNGGFFGNVDVRTGFPLGGELVDIVAVNRGGIRIFKIDKETRTLSNVTDGGSIPTGVSGEGLCLYHSARTGGFGVVTIARSGETRHLDLGDSDSDGLIDGVLRRSWHVGSEAEGCVFDDELGRLYIAEEDVGIWRYGAEPADPVGSGDRVSVDVVGSGGNLVSDVEGLAVVSLAGGGGYLIASAQYVADDHRSYFAVYERGGANAYVGAFRVAGGPDTDACSRTDGIEAVAAPLGSRFPEGLFICQDNENTAPGSSGNQNFKLVRLERAVDLGAGPPPSPGGGISVVGSTSDSSPEARTGITINRPPGTVAGDVLVASIGIVDDDPGYSAPAGWSRVRAATIRDSLRVETFVKVAGTSEPPTYTWTLPDWRRIAGGITSYRGVHTTSPVDVHNAQTQATNGTAVTAPSVSPSVPGTMLVQVAVTNSESAISPPAGMSEAWEATGWRVNNPRDVTISSSHAIHASDGPTGARTATATVAASRIGILLALRPAGDPGPDTTPPQTTITSGPTGTLDSDSAEFGFTSNEAGSTFECDLDDGGFEACVSPLSYTGLDDGQHTFSVVATDPAGNTDLDPATRTWTIDTSEPPPPPEAEITVIGSASDSNPNGRTSITIPRPAGTQPGDVMVASIGIVDDDPMYDAPPGWALARAETLHDSLRVETWVKVVGGSEPLAYTWTLPGWRRIAGGITAYRGVDADSPLDGINAASDPTDGTAVTAPSVSPSVPGTMLVQVAVTNSESAISPPAGMSEAWEATGWRVNNPRDVTISSSHAIHASDGPTGARTATATVAASRIGILLALRPAGDPGPDTTPPQTTITSGPTGTLDSDSAEFGFTSNEAGSTFECDLDDGGFEACVSPLSYTGLDDGQHTFSVVATDPAGNTDLDPATRTWTIDTSEPPPPPEAEITVIGSASDSNPNGRTSITIPRPAGTQPGDVMVAAIAIVDDDPSPVAPPGWVPVRSESVHDRLRVEVFTKVVGGSEPASYTWTLAEWRRVAGGISAFRGVHPTRPVDVYAGASWPNDAAVVAAPSISPSVAGAMLVHVAAVSGETSIEPPAGMGEDWEARGWRAASPRDVTIAASHALHPTAGATGDMSATTSPAGPGGAVLLALLPEWATPAAADPYTPIGTFPYTEASGVVASRRYPGVVWTERDSGDGVRNVLYAFRVAEGVLQPFPTGELYKAFPVPGTTNIDWEDIAIDDDGYLYVGDIGNNSSSRTNLSVYKVREPDPYHDASATVVATYPFRYPTGNYDAESLFFHGGTLYLVNKVGAPAPHTLFRFDTLTDGVQTTLVQVAQVAEPDGGFVAGGERIQAADLSHDGRFLAITTGYRIYVYAAPMPAGGVPDVADLVSHPPSWSLSHRADGSKEQVEAVTFLSDGSLVTASEFMGNVRYVDARLRPEP